MHRSFLEAAEAFFLILAPCRLMHRGPWFDPWEIFWYPGMLSFRYFVQIAQLC